MVVVRARGGSRRRAQASEQARRRARVVQRGVGRRVGVLGIDAGGTTGLFWWHGELKESIRETLVGGRSGFEQIDCGMGSVDGERLGAEKIARRWVDLEAEWTLDDVPVQGRYLAIEDFTLRAKIGSKQRVGLSSPRIAGLVEGMLVRRVAGSSIARYSPSRSKSFATSDRLKDWGLWARGAPHSRDAAKQVALHIAVLLD